MFNPLADVTVTRSTPLLAPEDMWSLAAGDDVAPFLPSWALACGCGNVGFATGDLPSANRALAEEGWLVFHTRVLCPICVDADD